MLVQLTIENFLSFREETTFSLIAVNNDQRHTDHLAVDAAGKGRSILPISAIYGANAAGKSNLIKALDFAKNLIVQGTRSGQSIPISTFKLGDDNKRPSKFEFIFTYKDNLYSYGFKLNTTQILEEWLYVTPAGKTREVVYFERITSENKETKVDFGASLKGRSNKNKQFLEFIEQGTRHNQLFLTEAVDRNVQLVNPVFDWFKQALTVIPAEANNRALELRILRSKEFTSFLSDFLKFADTGIDSIGTTELELDFDRYLTDIPENMRAEIIQDMSESEEDSSLIIENSLGKRYLIIKKAQGQLILIQIRTQHLHERGHFVDFAIDEESEGTQRLINLIPALFMLKESSEKVIFLDELDRRLHPLLSRKFVEGALKCKSQNNTSQLIFTTHDTNLLDLGLLRRDEIWFVEKNKQGVSHIYSLAEFKIRPDLEIEKGYLNGRFGAIPFFGDIRSLGWMDCEDCIAKTNNINNGKNQ